MFQLKYFYSNITIKSYSCFYTWDWNVPDPGNTLTHMTDLREMSNSAMWVSDLASDWPFDDLILILSRPRARATVSCRGHTLAPFSAQKGPSLQPIVLLW